MRAAVPEPEDGGAPREELHQGVPRHGHRHGDDEARGGGGTPAEQRPGEEDLHVQPHVERPVRGRGGGEVDRPTLRHMAGALCAVQSDASSNELIN